MFELKIEQERKYGEEIVLYFDKEKFEEMCILMQIVNRASKDEISFLIREIEEGQINEE